MMDEDKPLKDYGSFTHAPVEQDEIEGHHSEKWQQQAMYVGLHFPQGRGKKRRHHRHHRHRKSKDENVDPEPSKPLLPVAEEDGGSGHRKKGKDSATPPSQRVQFILGGADDEDEEHKAHDIFCELEELRGVGEDMEWKETARWIKFEEDVEEGGERWSKPFVATLALHSLFELRKGIMSGTIMLDLDANSLPQITDLVLDQMIAGKQLDQSQRDQVNEVLLSRHRHQHDREKTKGLPIIRSLADIGRKTSDRKIEGKDGSSCPTIPESKTDSSGHLTAGKNSSGRKGSSKDLVRNESGGDLPETPSQVKFNEHFAKKIPAGAEASNILVGEVDFLSHPILAFVRLSKAALLGDLTEVPVPTRFIFVLLGPTGNQQRYHEIGRSIATLMSDEVFHDVAYKARNRGDLLAGIDEFLDQVIVLPPGEWDPTIRIEPPKSVPSQEGRKTGGANSSGTPGLPNGMAIQEEEEEEHGDATLVRTGRIFGGLINDLKRKVPLYPSDIKDALDVQCIASFFFMYFACLTPIITFGGLLGSATDNNMAALESLTSGAICGISYHLFAGQPLTIIGSTGPVLVFETIVYHFAHDHGLDYLALRFWIGMWVSLTLMVIVAFDLSALVRYITRFTEESFAALIALIFIVEAFKKLFHILHDYPVAPDMHHLLNYHCDCVESNITLDINATMSPTTVSMINATERDWLSVPYDECKKEGGTLVGPDCAHPRPIPDVFFFSVLVFIGTFTISYSLKFFRNTSFFPNRVRGLISDFAVMVAIVIMVGVDAIVHLPTPKLNVPEDFKPTRSDRGWVINPFKNPVWTLPACIAPALLATILIFMDQQITAVIINRKEHKLKKGSGYHLDLFLISVQIMVCSILGTPWFVAATVLSINHVRSLTVESETSAPGERPKFLGIREQRVTGILVFFFVGMSVFLTSVLKHIPMPVLYGVFLFMGVSSLTGVQLMERIGIMLMPAKYQPNLVFLRHVPVRRVHLFTCIQVLCLALLWCIKTIKSISIIFPLMVLAMCFVRKGLDYVFTHHELKWLDDIMPESHKQEKEEEKRKLQEETLQDEIKSTPGQMIEMTGGAVNIPLQGGQSIKVPVDRITYDPQSNEVNISEEMGKTAIWKQLVANEPNAKINKEKVRHRKSGKRDPEEGKTNSDSVKFTIAEEETESLMPPSTPEIVVDPPSKGNTPDNGSFLKDGANV